jgi:hypothetical protein
MKTNTSVKYTKMARIKLFAAALGTSLLLGLGAQAEPKFSFAAIGDVPYEPVTNGHQVYPVPQYERLIDHVNGDPSVEFTVHIGDIKAGNTLCEDNVYANNLAYFNSFQNPVIFTPGDNEWTDCHRANNGSMDPLERLLLLRTLFYDRNRSLGQNPIPLFKDREPYVENSVWRQRLAIFVTLHQPGSNNNRNRTTGLFPDLTDSEYTARNASNMAFLDSVFFQAHYNPQVKLVVIASQANPFERFIEPGQGYTVSGYADFIEKVRSFVATHPDKNVLYINGDTHTPRINHPLTDIYPSPTQLTPAGTPYLNFTRVEVYAQTAALSQWFKVNVDVDGSFSIETQVVPSN